MSAKKHLLPMALVSGIDRVIEVVSMIIAVTTIVVMFLSLMGEVVVRYITNQGMGWPTEMPNLLFPGW